MRPKHAVDDKDKNFLTEAEMSRFLEAAKGGRNGVRNIAMLLLTFRDGLRVSELIDIRLKDIDVETARIFVRRNKGSLSTHQPLEGDELRAIRAWLICSPFSGQLTKKQLPSQEEVRIELDFELDPNLLLRRQLFLR